ncbi:MAG TPA: hypothetical protein VGM90_27085 [Kofleriaceae bacterium]
MRSAFLLVALVPACGFQVGGGVSSDGAMSGDDAAGSGSGSDAGDDASATGSDAPTDPSKCFGGYHQVCLAELPTGELRFKGGDNGGSNNFDTGNDPRCVATTSGGAGLCVMVGTTVTIDNPAILRAHNSARPLVLIATTGDITVGGTIDVSSHVGTNQGAGANGNGGTETCNTGMVPSFAGGGPGGSFASIGGDGGNSNAAGFMAVGGDHGGVIPFVSGMLRGGCKGIDGAKVPMSTGVGGPGGNSGGAVLLIGTASVTVGGLIDASGSGGQGGSLGANNATDGFNRAGGGGGGTGGMIVIDAPTLTVGGRLWAEGGGGGEGGGTQLGANGTSGTPGGMAPGGTGHDGGDGGAGSQAGGTGFIGMDGGSLAPGGGGGGGGFNYTTAGTRTIAAGSSPPIGNP